MSKLTDRLEFNNFPVDEPMIRLTEECLDDAVVGVTVDYRLVYDFDILINILMEHNNWSEDEAIEYFDFKIAASVSSSSSVYPMPVVMYKLLDVE